MPSIIRKKSRYLFSKPLPKSKNLLLELTRKKEAILQHVSHMRRCDTVANQVVPPPRMLSWKMIHNRKTFVRDSWISMTKSKIAEDVVKYQERG